MRAQVRDIHGSELIVMALEPGEIQVGDVINIERPKSKRTLDANAYLWVCIGTIAKEVSITAWDCYLMMLKRYGQYTSTAIRADAYEQFKKRWRECEIVDEFTSDGEKFYRILCYFGSSKYTKNEFAKLLNGIISEIQEMGLPVPPTRQDEADFKNYMRLI